MTALTKADLVALAAEHGVEVALLALATIVEPPETITVTRKRLLDAIKTVLDPDYSAMDSWGTDVYSIDRGDLEDFTDEIIDNLKATP